MPRGTWIAPLSLPPEASSAASRTSTIRTSPRFIRLRTSPGSRRGTAALASASISLTLDGIVFPPLFRRSRPLRAMPRPRSRRPPQRTAFFQASLFRRESGLIAQQHATRQAAQKMLWAADRKTLRNLMADARWPYDMLRPCRGFRLNFSRDDRRDRAVPLIPPRLSPRRTMGDHTLLPEYL